MGRVSLPVYNAIVITSAATLTFDRQVEAESPTFRAGARGGVFCCRELKGLVVNMALRQPYLVHFQNVVDLTKSSLPSLTSLPVGFSAE